MEGPILLFARMMVIGVAVAAPVGAMGVLCIQRTLARGWRAGFVTGAGIATADGIYAATAAFGLTAVSTFLLAYQAPLRIIGGIALIWLGGRALFTSRGSAQSTVPDEHEAPHSGTGDVDDPSPGLARLYASAVGLTLTNPLTIMAFAAIFTAAGLVAQPGAGGALVVTCGVIAGSLLWWLLLTGAVAAVRHALSTKVLMWVDRISGVVLVAFGLFALIAGVHSLVG